MKKLTAEEARKYLKKTDGWHFSSDHLAIEKKLMLNNFTDAVFLVNKIAELAEESDHHPDLHLTGYKYLNIVLSTHAAGGLTRKDFDLAAQIDGLPL